MSERVIVVGAGPTGLMLAHELALAGVACTVLEKRAEQPNITRAFGMNTGIGDAMNLGWKLAAELRGTAPGWLLDSYESERHPVGAAVLTEWCGPALPALVLDGDARGVRQRSERTNR